MVVLLLFVVAQESLKEAVSLLLVSAGKYEQMAQHIAALSSSAQVGQGSCGWVGHPTGVQGIHLQADARC